MEEARSTHCPHWQGYGIGRVIGNKSPVEGASRRSWCIIMGRWPRVFSICVRGLQKVNYQAKLGAVNLLRDRIFLVLGGRRVPLGVLILTPLIPCAAVRKKSELLLPYSGSVVPSTVKAQYYVDHKGEFHPLLQSRYWRVNLDLKDKLITDKFIL